MLMTTGSTGTILHNLFNVTSTTVPDTVQIQYWSTSGISVSVRHQILNTGTGTDMSVNVSVCFTLFTLLSRGSTKTYAF